MLLWRKERKYNLGQSNNNWAFFLKTSLSIMNGKSVKELNFRYPKKIELTAKNLCYAHNFRFLNVKIINNFRSFGPGRMMRGG